MNTVAATTLETGITLGLRLGNIALADVDAVVNAANEYLNLGSGVAGAIRELGGEIIQRECHEIGFCPVGSAVITTGGNLSARFVIHAVGPMYGEGNENEKLASAVRSALTIAEARELKSIAMPALSSGFFHFPITDCAAIIIGTIRTMAPTLKSVKQITIYLQDQKKLDVFKNALEA